MAAVLPESMDRLNVEDTRGSLSIIENYIRYMGERIEFSMRNMTKVVSAAGVSSAEMYVLITAMSNALSALQSTVNGMSGNITSLTNTQTSMQATLEEMQAQLDDLETRMAEFEQVPAQLEALEARVVALETT